MAKKTEEEIRAGLNRDYTPGSGRVISPSTGKPVNNPDFDTDYMQKAHDSAAMGDYSGAGYWEGKHNEKDKKYDLGYGESNIYGVYRPFEYDEFQYDYTKDKTYQDYAKQYTQNAKRSVEDTLGKYAGMTGGMPSTAAMGAAAQAGALELSKLSDKIPELEALAYQRYANERNQAYNQYMDNRSFDYNMRETARNWAYQRERDRISDAKNDAKYADEIAHDRAYDYFKATGDPSAMVGAGYWTEEAGEQASKRIQDDNSKTEAEYKRSIMSNAVQAYADYGSEARTMFPDLTDDEWAKVVSMATTYMEKQLLDVYSSGGSGAKKMSSETSKVEPEDDEEENPEENMESTKKDNPFAYYDVMNITSLGLPKSTSISQIDTLVGMGLLRKYKDLKGKTVLSWAKPENQMVAYMMIQEEEI